MKKEWFEPGRDGVPFEREFYKGLVAGVGTGTAIAAAFRALLAEQAATPPALQVGDVVRLEDPGTFCVSKFIGVEATITGFTKGGNIEYTSSLGNSWWPRTACTLIRRAGEVEQHDERDALINQLRESLERTKLALNTTREQRDQFWSQRDAARAEVERLQGELQHCNHMNRDLTTERDALEQQVEAWQDATGMVGIYSDGSEGDPGDVTPEMMSKHLDELRSKASELDKVLAVLMHAYLDPDVIGMSQCGIPSQVSNWITVCQQLRTDRNTLQASLRDEQAKRESIEAELAACRQIRDALQARIEAGVRVWGSGSVFGGESSRDSSDTHTALLIDIQPIATEMVDERKTPGTRADRRLA